MELLLLSQNNCAPCKELKLFLTNEEIAFTEVNLSENPDLVSTYNVMSTPVTILMDGNEEVARVNGLKKDEVLDLADEL